MRKPQLAKLAAIAILASACVGDTVGTPRGWGPLALGEGPHCPAVAGRYFDTSQPIAVLLAAHPVGMSTSPDEWAWFELSGVADTSLSVTVALQDGTEQTGRLRRGSPSGGDYYCEDGWLHIANRNISNQFDDDAENTESRPNRRAMRVAKTLDGALVARLDFVSYSEVTVWCGDGCKGFPVPGTSRTRSQWSAAEPWDPDETPGSAARLGETRGGRTRDRRQVESERLRLEELRLENGPDGAASPNPMPPPKSR
jgi:hypothetical protein